MSERGLSVIRAASARHHFQTFDFLAHGFLEDGVGQEDKPICAGVGAQALKAGVVRFYGVVVLLSGWMRVGRARLFGVHSL